jgi:general secretion pathway protein D
LNQKKAVDFSAATSVIVKSGQIAKAQSIREIMVPTDYDPPQIPQTAFVDNTDANFNPLAVGGASPIVPATPTEFEMVEVGLNLEVEATIPEEGNVVEITVSPDYSEFEGFVNYGSPILTGGSGGTTIQLTENAILQHVVRHLRMQKTTLSVYDGATFVIGGLSESRVTAIEDKVPLLGDVPLLGRLFRSKATSNSRKAILFFVSVNLLDPAGRRTSDFGNTITIK